MDTIFLYGEKSMNKVRHLLLCLKEQCKVEQSQTRRLASFLALDLTSAMFSI